MTTVRSQRSFVKHMNLAVFLPMMLLALITFTFYIVSGFSDAYESKIRQVNDLSSLLAISSSSATGSVIASAQISQISYQDRTIENAQFYPFERIDNLTNPEAWHLLTILTENSVSIQEPVASDVSAHRATGQKSNRTLMGYINITIDLDELRKQWLNEHRYHLLGIALVYLLMTWLMLYRMAKPLHQIEKLSIASLNTAKVDIDNIHPLLNYEFDYLELAQIQELIHYLNMRYKTEHEKYQKAKYLDSQEKRSQKTSLQESSFQSMITHDLKTSLDVIFGGLQLLDNHYMSEEQKEVVESIRKGSRQLEFTLNQIIQLNRIEKGQMSVRVEPFQPIQLINELVDEYQKIVQSRGIKIYSHINHIDCILQGDEQKIRSILQALISNAFKFTEQGSIEIESNLVYFKDSIRWSINVIDTGVGIDDKHLEDILSPFTHSNLVSKNEFSDTSISLGLANKIAQLMKGQILVESEVNKGSKFSLVIPLLSNRYSQQHQLIVNTKVIFFTLKNLDSIMNALYNAGAHVVKMDDQQRILDYLRDNYVNLLIIASDITYAQAIKLTLRVRENEVSSRTLIAYYQNDMTQKQIDEMQAAGVDLCRPIATDNLKAEAVVLKKWLGL